MIIIHISAEDPTEMEWTIASMALVSSLFLAHPFCGGNLHVEIRLVTRIGWWLSYNSRKPPWTLIRQTPLDLATRKVEDLVGAGWPTKIVEYTSGNLISGSRTGPG